MNFDQPPKQEIKKSSSEMRAQKIPEKIKANLSPDQDFEEANHIALKINTLIDSLPTEKQTDASKKFLDVLNGAKDIYFYKELHDSLFELNKDEMMDRFLSPEMQQKVANDENISPDEKKFYFEEARYYAIEKKKNPEYKAPSNLKTLTDKYPHLFKTAS